MLHLRLDASIAQILPHVPAPHVPHVVMLPLDPVLQRLHEMQRRAAPDPKFPTHDVVLVPGFTVRRPHGSRVPRVDVLIELRHGLLAHLEGADIFSLDPRGAGQDVFDADFVRGERSPSGPVATHAVHDEVIRELRHCGREVDLRFWVEGGGHGYAFGAFDFAIVGGWEGRGLAKVLREEGSRRRKRLWSRS